MRKIIRIKTWQSRMLLVMLFTAVLALANTPKPVNGMAPWGIPLQVEILYPYAIPPVGVANDGGGCYEDQTITGSPDVQAYTSAGGGLRMYVVENRSVLIDFSQGANGGPSLCSMGDVAGPIESVLRTDGGGCYVQWPLPGTAALLMNVGGMFSDKFKPGQTLVTGFSLEFNVSPFGSTDVYRLSSSDPVLVTFESDGIHRVAQSSGAGRATLKYWDQSKNKFVKIGDFNVPLWLRGVTCPDGVCPPGPCP
jgi:hypothetical protein